MTDKILNSIYLKATSLTLAMLLAFPLYLSPKKKRKTEEVTPRIYLYSDKKVYNHKDGIVDMIGRPKLLGENEEIIAKNMKYFKDARDVIASGKVKIVERENSLTFYGTKAKYNALTKNATLKGKAKVVSKENDFSLLSNELIRDNINKSIFATERVTLIREKEGTRIYADSALYDLEEKKVILKGNTKIVYNFNTYIADKITAYVEKDLAILEGNCKILSDEKEIFADRIHYVSDETSEKAILYGNTSFLEKSRPDSFLKGEVFRRGSADKIYYYTRGTNYLKVTLIGDAIVTEKYVKKEDEEAIIKLFSEKDEEGKPIEADSKEEKKEEKKRLASRMPGSEESFGFGKTGNVVVKVEKRESQGDKIQLIRKGEIDKVVILDDAVVSQPGRAGFADRIIYYSDEKIMKLLGNAVFYEFFNEKELYEKKNPYFTENSVKRKAESDFLYYFLDEERLFLKGDAAVLDEDREIYGDMIEYLGASQQGYVVGNASVIKKNQIAKSKKLEFEGKAEKVKMYQNVRLLDEDGRSTANKLEYLIKQDKAILSGNAIVFDKEQEAVADEIEYYPGDNDKAILKGNPKLIKGNLLVISDEAEYIKKKDGTQTLKLYGNVEAFEENLRVSSEEMVYNKKTNTEDVTFIGNARYNDDEMEGAGHSIKYERTKEDGLIKQEKITLEGYKEPKKEGEEDFDLKNDDDDEKDDSFNVEDKRKEESKGKEEGDNEDTDTEDEDDDEDKDKAENKNELPLYDETPDELLNKARIKQGNIRGRAQKIVYTKNNQAKEDKEKIVMEGKPEILQEDKYAKADKITYIFDKPEEGQGRTNKGIAILEEKAFVKDKNKKAVADKIKYYNQEENRIELFDNGKFYDREENLEVRADYLYYNETLKYAETSKNPENKFSRSPVFYQEEENIVIEAERMKSYMEDGVAIAEGDVRITQKDSGEVRKIYGESARMYSENYGKNLERYRTDRDYRKKIKKLRNKVIVTGNPKLVRDKDLAHGTRIIIDTKKKQIEIYDLHKGKIKISGKSEGKDDDEEIEDDDEEGDEDEELSDEEREERKSRMEEEEGMSDEEREERKKEREERRETEEE